MIRLILIALLLSSCSYLTKTIDDEYYAEISSTGEANELKLLFSNNIDGETHPCGCRKYPLGGLAQIAGEMYELKQKFPTIYVDTGDAFFPSPNIPEMVQNSLKFKAQEIAHAMKKLGLKFYVPGDQDFAMGEQFLNEILTKSKISVLASNFKKTVKIKHKKWGLVKFGDTHLFFIGVINSEFKGSDISQFLTEPIAGITNSLAEIKKEYPNVSKKKIILLSHSGIDKDEEYATKFPQIDWIIGSHSQSFLRNPITVNNVKIGQAKSRNHYLGKITISSNPKVQDKYELIEVRDFLANKWKDNPYIAWLDKHKKDLEKIQLQEQNIADQGEDSNNLKVTTAVNCMSCHTEQTEFWQKTAHSISYYTLLMNNEHHNSNCIGCHSLEYQNPKAFVSTKKVVLFDDKRVPHDEKFNNYLEALKTDFKSIKSVRELASKDMANYSKKWFKLDEKFNVTYNYANVQCLNCHEQSLEHPFDGVEAKTVNFQSKCLECHTTDQSPEWYSKDEKGVASELNKEYFAKKLKSVACPKNSNE